MNLRSTCLIVFVALLACQLTWAQTAAHPPNNTLTSKAAVAAQLTGKAAPVVPAVAGAAARPNVWVGPTVPIAPKVTGEPGFCEGPYGPYFLYCPKGVQTAYGVNSIIGGNGGAGMTIAIVDAFAYPYAESNFATFNTVMSLPACTTGNGCFTSVNFSPYDGSGSGWDLESMLDLEYAHAMAPNAKIIYVQAYDNSYDGLGMAVAWAAAHADVVSNSWSGGEYPYYDFYWAQSVPLLFASGDYANWPSQGFVGYPCSANGPAVTCVGGTTLHVDGTLHRTSETAWADAGGGCSELEAMPAWQGNNGSGICFPTHASPDIAALADPLTGVVVYLSNPVSGTHYYIVGGTSVATPLMAGLVADIDTARVSFGKAKLSTNLTSGVYQYANSNYNYFFYDVTSGSNGYPAGFQYDLVTGLGVPNGKSLANRFFGLP